MSTTAPTSRPRPLATVTRITAQLKADPRTVGLVLVVPPLLVALLYCVFMDVPTRPGQIPTFDRVGPIMLAVLPMMMMFLITSVVMLRERTSGTLERILTTPLSRWNLVASYATVFAVLSILQAIILALVLAAFGVQVDGPWWLLVVVAFLDAVFGIAFGIMASAFARSEFQAVQFMPAFVGPQIFLCGLLVPIENMPRALEMIANIMPMTWAVEVVRDIVADTVDAGAAWRILTLVLASCLALAVAARSMPRQTR